MATMCSLSLYCRLFFSLKKFPVTWMRLNWVEIMSTAELVKGVDKLDMSQRQILFGSYAEVWDDTTNTMKE